MVSHRQPSWWQALVEVPRREKVAALVAFTASVVLLISVWVWGANKPTPEAAAASQPTMSAAPVDRQTSSESAVKSGVAVPDGAAPDSPPYGIDAQAMLVEVRSHGIVLQDADAQKLLMIGNAGVSRGQPDLAADDPQIARDVESMFPQFTEQNRRDATRCLAEFVERVIARNAGTVPPDSQHGEN